MRPWHAVVAKHGRGSIIPLGRIDKGIEHELVATMLSTTVDILRFVTFHLDAGARSFNIYLDDPDLKLTIFSKLI